MQSLGFWKGSCRLKRGALRQLLIPVLIGFCMAAMVAMPIPAAAQTVNFSINNVGNTPQTQTQQVPKGCPGSSQTLTKATLTIGPLDMTTGGTFTNTSGAVGNLIVRELTHDVLKVEIPSGPGTNSLVAAPPTESTGQDTADCLPGPACVPPGPGNNPVNSWTWSLPTGGTANITPPFVTAKSSIVQVFTSATDLSFFKANLPGDTFPGNFTAQGSRTLTTPSTFTDLIVTNATAAIQVVYECNQLSAGLQCVSKTFDKNNLPPGGGVVKATVVIKNTGDFDITDLVIKSVMSNAAKMSIVAGSSSLPGGNPVQAPAGTWTFPTQSLLAHATLTFSYSVNVTNLLPAEELCNQITASSALLGISSDGPACRACVTSTPTVPALGTIGYSVALAMVTLGGIVLYRQRRRKA
jgi:hypothetical protein